MHYVIYKYIGFCCLNGCFINILGCNCDLHLILRKRDFGNDCKQYFILIFFLYSYSVTEEEVLCKRFSE